MRTWIIILGLLFVSFNGSFAVADEGGEVQVENKICPISGEKIGSMGEGAKVGHMGKMYNLCCSGCEKGFKKDPDQFVKKIEAQMEEENKVHQ